MSEYYCQKCNHKLTCYSPGLNSYWICEKCQELYILKRYEKRVYDNERRKYITIKKEEMIKDLRGN